MQRGKSGLHTASISLTSFSNIFLLLNTDGITENEEDAVLLLLNINKIILQVVSHCLPGFPNLCTHLKTRLIRMYF